MVKTHWVKVAVACGTALTLSLGCCSALTDTSAATLCQETEMAGISLSLDKYYADNFDSESDETVVAEDTAQEASASAVTEATAAPATATPKATAAPTTTPAVPKVAKQFQNTALSIAGDYVNIRKTPSTNGKILGKLYEGSSAKVLGTKNGWSKITSGSVTGYIKSEFLATGAKAEKLASKYGTYYAKVKPGTITLNVRTKPNTSCTIVTQIPEDENYRVLNIGKDWVKITIDGEKGYVAKEFVTLHAKFKKAVSIKEEEAEKKRIAAAEAAEKARLEQLAREQQAAKSASSNSGSSNSSSTRSSSSNTTKRSTSSSSSRKSSTSRRSSSSRSNSSSSGSNSSYSGSGSGAEIAAYAQKFVGNRYVYGGSSLTRGTDCSGFTMSVYLQFGYSLPHSSAAQASCGRKVSLSSVQPGDLIFYRNGSRIGHVAMYIGGGRVVHASNPSDGIKISSMRYRTPACARRIVG